VEVFFLHKYFSYWKQIFSRKFFTKLLEQNEVISMNLKGYPFEPLGDITPCGPPIGGGPGTPL
jgi:hypothetical protein